MHTIPSLKCARIGIYVFSLAFFPTFFTVLISSADIGYVESNRCSLVCNRKKNEKDEL
jgi:hypothetical protein